MSKKNKNKGFKGQQSNKQVVVAQGPKITEEIKESAAGLESKLSDLDAETEAGADASQELSAESANKFETAEKKEDVAGYLKYLRELNLRLEMHLSRASSLYDESKKEKEKVDAEKKEFEAEKKQLKDERAALSKKDIDLKKRARELEDGQYSEIIDTLLESLNESQEKVLKGTKERIQELSELHGKTMDAMMANQNELAELEKEKLLIQRQMRELKREQTRFELAKEYLKADTEEEFSVKYQSSIDTLEAELSRSRSKIKRMEEENVALKASMERIFAAFEDVAPEEMVQRILFYKGRVEELTRELNERPDKFVYVRQTEMIALLQQKVDELEEQINEKELAELRIRLANQDNFIIERMRLKSEIESAQVREEHYTRQIRTLEETINLLKEDKAKKAEAFEFARNADADPRFTQVTFPRKEPADLPSFVTYIQGRMIDSRKDNGQLTSFYYDKQTIRIFLAGLHMSPISILQGISGTGKTSLPREFAKALIADEHYRGISPQDKTPNAPYRICAIQSGWRDNMDLMGYYNSFDNKYKETDFFKALYLANLPKYSNSLFFIILDEMNLSRPEHYFADFLSLLEQAEDERYISIGNVHSEALPLRMEGGKLPVPKNVRFIGTANHDETTLEFAPKTYDRSNLMEMPRNISQEGQPIPAMLNISYKWLELQFLKAEQTYKAECAKFNAFISSKPFKELLEDKNIGIGNRFEKQADKFISVYLASGTDKAVDLAVAADHLITRRLFRTLKNRYEIDKAGMQAFKEMFEMLFVEEFKQTPKFANMMLDEEIRSK